MKICLKMVLSLCIVVSLSSCDWPWEDDDDDLSVTSGVEESSTETAVASTTAEETTTDAEESSDETTTVTEFGTYWGRTNGERPTWYFWKSMSRYPDTFYLTIEGCATDLEVSNNGSRWESSGYLAKQSDVSGRGLAVLAPSSCSATRAYVSYSE